MGYRGVHRSLWSLLISGCISFPPLQHQQLAVNIVILTAEFNTLEIMIFGPHFGVRVCEFVNMLMQSTVILMIE